MCNIVQFFASTEYLIIVTNNVGVVKFGNSGGGEVIIKKVCLHGVVEFIHWIWPGRGGSDCIMTSSNGNIFRVTGHLCGEFPGHRWIPLTKASDAALMFSLICAWTNGWANNRAADGWRRHRAHYDVIVMVKEQFSNKYYGLSSWVLKIKFVSNEGVLMSRSRLNNGATHGGWHFDIHRDFDTRGR